MPDQARQISVSRGHVRSVSELSRKPREVVHRFVIDLDFDDARIVSGVAVAEIVLEQGKLF